MKQWTATIVLSCWLSAFGGSTVLKGDAPRVGPDFLRAKEAWVEETMNAMTLEERIGQLFMVAAYSNRDEAHVSELKQLIEEYHIGGLIFFQGGPVRQALMCNELQAASKVPMMIGMDAEWGLDMRLDSTIGFPRQMTLGAIRNDSLIYKMGREIGRQFRRLGMHINFAPVADVNNNPENPVINSRSFGEDRDNVARKSAAYMQGLQDEHILANAKHFPGHGDTDTDSHKALPVIYHSRERLDSIELYPFRQLIARGLASAMVAHMYIPALDSSAQQASTLSSKIVNDLLRDELGFKGLIVTDALNMRGVSDHFKAGDLELRALLAGNDILLFAEDVPEAVRLIRKAIDEGTIDEKTINDHCKRILHAKAWAGLDNYRPILIENLVSELNPPQAYALRNETIRSALTLIGNSEQTLPISAGAGKRILALAVGNTDHEQYQHFLARYDSIEYVALPSEPEQNTIDRLLTKCADYDIVLVSIHGTNQRPSRNFGLSDEAIVLINLLNKDNKVVLTHFGNPYALLDLKSLSSIDAAIVAYQDDEATRDAAAQAIFGGLSLRGTLPVSITDRFGVGSGAETEKIRMAYAMPEAVGMDSETLQAIDSIANAGIAEMAYPGCQILVARRGNIVYNKSFGYQTYENVRPVQQSDMYDVASLTKIMASVPALMYLQDQGKFDLDKTLGDYLDFIPNDSPYHAMSLRKVLAHQAGLIPWIPFYVKTLKDGKPRTDIYSATQSDQFPVRVSEGLYIKREKSDSLIFRILSTRLRSEREMRDSEYIYSDLGYYFVKAIVETLSDTSLDAFVDQKIYQPLGLSTMGYKPRKRFSLQRIVPTEYDTYFRGRLIHGDVHDPGAAMQGGVGGHAGIFSNAYDVAVMMQTLIDDGLYNGQRIFESSTIEEYTECQFCIDENDKNRRGAGFDKPVMDDGPGPTCKCVTFNTFGHTGFTGTMAWADPEQDLVYIFLSNRVYPTAENKKLVRMNIRTDIQEVIYDSLLD